jgi:hypothetical protein
MLSICELLIVSLASSFVDQYTDPASYVAMMRDQAAKRSRMSGDRCNKSRHKLPDLLPKRPASHDLSHRRNEDGFQSALIKAVL